MHVIVGNWNPGNGPKGLSVYRYQEQTGSLEFLSRTAGQIGASFLGYDPAKHLFYATNETDGWKDGQFANQIAALKFDRDSETLAIAGVCSSFGPNPCWICPDGSGLYLLIAHHGGFSHVSRVRKTSEGRISETRVLDEPNIIVMRLRADGTFDGPSDAFLPKDSSGETGRMSRSHSIHRSLYRNIFLACDKGLDQIISLRLDPEAGTLSAAGALAVFPDCAPRYGVMHPTLPVFYADMEGAPVVYSIRYNENGDMEILQILNLLPGRTGSVAVMPSDIVFGPDCRHLYVGLRAINQIAVIDVSENGTLSFKALISVPDGAPNTLRFSPDGCFLFVPCVF